MSDSMVQASMGSRWVPLAKLLVLAVLLIALRVPLQATEHRQEDAFITLRCAAHLAETGNYEFNSGERVSASTSHAYVAVAAVAHWLIADHFLGAVFWLNSVLFLSGLSGLVFAIGTSRKERLLLFVAGSVLPVGLEITSSAMETSLLVAMLGWLLYSESRRSARAFFAAGLLPFVRPDAIVYSLVLVLVRLRSEPRRALRLGLSTLAGGIGLLAFNLAYFGPPLHQTILAKWEARGAHPSWSQRLGAAWEALFGAGSGGTFAPLPSRYLDGLQWVFLVPLVALWLVFLRRREAPDDAALGRRWCLLAALIPPVLYGLGGVTFSWYLWPSVLVGHLAAVDAVIDLSRSGSSRRRLALGGLLVLCLLAGYVARLALSYRWGVLESRYRAGIGEFLREEAPVGATLLLEPAGYIPFYSGLYTADEIGLVCPAVTSYRKSYGPGWWSRFVKEKRPTYIVERPHLRQGVTLDGHRLPAPEWEQFQLDYERIRRFSFDADAYASGGAAMSLLRLGSASEYDVYRRRGVSSQASDHICR